MDLPIRMLDAVPKEPVISVDGAWGAPGLNLSHWPGHATPPALRHELSTGCALAFARLEDAERARLAAGCTAIANNHYDTDGVLSLFAVRRPREALERADALLAGAACGDFYQVPDEASMQLDALVGAFVDPDRSPLDLADLGDLARYELAARALVDELPGLLDGGLADHEELWSEVVEGVRSDRADLRASARDELVHLDWTVWTAPESAAANRFAPCRHALYGETASDRVLVVAPRDGGNEYRFVLSTRSWFDLPENTTQPRPDLDALALRLNELEGTDPAGPAAWRTQAALSPSPELWFGLDDAPSLTERNPSLRPSALEPTVVKRAVADALREALVLPD